MRQRAWKGAALNRAAPPFYRPARAARPIAPRIAVCRGMTVCRAAAQNPFAEPRGLAAAGRAGSFCPCRRYRWDISFFRTAAIGCPIVHTAGAWAAIPIGTAAVGHLFFSQRRCRAAQSGGTAGAWATLFFVPPLWGCTARRCCRGVGTSFFSCGRYREVSYGRRRRSPFSPSERPRPRQR
jgi:hypothetical protein